MQTFYVVLEKEIISIFEKNHDSYEKVYIEGNPEYTYEINCAKACTDKLLSILVNVYNLDSAGEIDLVMIDNEDKVVSEVIDKALSKHIKEKIQIDDLICRISQKLDRDENLHISEYGINFDGKNYLCKSSGVKKSEFYLLGYTVSADELLKYAE